MLHFNKIPFARLLISFIGGILIGIFFLKNYLNIYIPLVCLAGMVCFVLMKRQEKTGKLFFLLLADLFLVFLGIDIVSVNSPYVKKDLFSNFIVRDSLTFVGEIDEIPVIREKNTKLILNVKKVQAGKDYRKTCGQVMVYIRKGKSAENFKAGNTLLIKTRLNELNEPLNPRSFNFKGYFNDRGIFYTAFVDSTNYRLIESENSSFSFWQTGLKIKQWLLDQLQSSGLNKDAYTICSALITGYDDEIDKSVMESFSHSGTLHVLSVSGLHVGLIYMLLNSLFMFFDRKKKFKIVQFVFITLTLWAFALVTGFSAPVLRSVIMFNLLGIGRLFFNSRSNQINILCVSAFILLMFDPLLIRNIGFLLSYLAIFGILYLYPRIEGLYKPEHFILKYVWQSTVLSLSATITTLPVTLCVFHQFPIWFAFANLIIVPASFVLLLLGFIALFKFGVIVILINALTGLLIQFIRIFDSGTYGYIDMIDFNFTDALFLTLVILLLNVLLVNRTYKSALFLFAILITWQILSLKDSFEKKTKSEFVIYHVNRTSVMSVKNNTQTYLTEVEHNDLNNHVKPNLISYNYPETVITGFNYVQSREGALLVLKDSGTIPDSAKSNIKVLVVCENHIPDEELLSDMHLNKVVADGSNNNASIRKLEDLCSKFGIEFYNTRYKGAYIHILN